MVDAALGGHVDVETPDGRMTIELPAGTQNGQRFRLRKRGVPKLAEEGRGDLYVEARIVVPTVTDDPGRALLREFARVFSGARRVGRCRRRGGLICPAAAAVAPTAAPFAAPLPARASST